jgi:D-tyrosyl-tRNA(Tyr) deacylase
VRAVVQRVHEASVEVDGRVVGEIQTGLLAYVGVHRLDGTDIPARMADRLVGVRIFSDPDGKVNLSLRNLVEAGSDAGLLLVSNFTVYGDASKNRRPSFTDSAAFEPGLRAFERLVAAARALVPNVQTGVFGADMRVRTVNDGPVTLILEVGP